MAGVHSVCTSHQRLVASAPVLAESGLNVLITVYISAVRNMREKTTQNKGQVQARERKNLGAWEHLAQQRWERSCNEPPVPHPALLSVGLCTPDSARSHHPQQKDIGVLSWWGEEMEGHWGTGMWKLGYALPQHHSSTPALLHPISPQSGMAPNTTAGMGRGDKGREGREEERVI